MAITPIKKLIQTRCKNLGISYRDVIERAGYVNINKGLRRLRQLFDGDFKSNRSLIESLPVALDLPSAEIKEAIEQTESDIIANREKERRAYFKPHAVVITANNGRPRSITFAALVNATRYIVIVFPDGANPEYYRDIAIAEYQSRKNDIALFYHDPEEIIINYTPDHAERITLHGEHIAYLDHAVTVALPSISIK